MIVSTSETVAGHRITKTLGLVLSTLVLFLFH